MPELKRFLREGADVHALYPLGDRQLSLMRMAVLYDHADCVELLAQHGGDVEERDETGELNLLMMAAVSGPACVRALLAAGADPNARTANGLRQTPLMLAAMQGHPACLQALAEGGAATELLDASGRTALYYAAALGRHQCVEILLQAGARLHLLRAAQVAESNGYGDTAELLKAADVRGGAPLTAGSPCNDVEEAVVSGQTERVSQFLTQGVEQEIKSLLILAAENGQVEVLRMLVESGADTSGNACDAGPAEVALKAAAMNGHADCMAVLLAHGASAAGFGIPLCSVKSNESRCVQLVLNAGVPVNRRYMGGRTLLMQAAREGCAESLEALLAAGADVCLKDDEGKTAMDIASENNHADCVTLLHARSAGKP